MVFLIGSAVSLCTSRELQSRVSLALRLFLSGLLFSQQAIYWNCFSSCRRMVLSLPILWKSTRPRSHSLVTLLLIYSATKKVRLILHNAPLYIIVHGAYFILEWHHCHSGDTEIFEPLVSGVSPSLRQQRIDFIVETHMLSVWFETLTEYPNARSPSTGVLIDLDDTIWPT